MTTTARPAGCHDLPEPVAMVTWAGPAVMNDDSLPNRLTVMTCLSPLRWNQNGLTQKKHVTITADWLTVMTRQGGVTTPLQAPAFSLSPVHVRADSQRWNGCPRWGGPGAAPGGLVVVPMPRGDPESHGRRACARVPGPVAPADGSS